MQDYDWNNLKYLLALHRGGTLHRAAQICGVNETTVARRIARLEKQFGGSLFLRGTSGEAELTDLGLHVLSYARRMETEYQTLQATALQSEAGVAGTVRLTSVPLIINYIIAGASQDLLIRHPNLTLELVPGADNMDLTRREADIALRFARPRHGGLKVKAQKLGQLRFAPYASGAEMAGQLPWVCYDDTHAGLPQAQWMEREAHAEGIPVPLRVSDAATALEAVAAGTGKTLLPEIIGDKDSRIRRLPDKGLPELPARDLWMLSHKDQAGRATVQVVKEWLTGLNWGGG